MILAIFLLSSPIKCVHVLDSFGTIIISIGVYVFHLKSTISYHHEKLVENIMESILGE